MFNHDTENNDNIVYRGVFIAFVLIDTNAL